MFGLHIETDHGFPLFIALPVGASPHDVVENAWTWSTDPDARRVELWSMTPLGLRGERLWDSRGGTREQLALAVRVPYLARPEATTPT